MTIERVECSCNDSRVLYRYSRPEDVADATALVKRWVAGRAHEMVDHGFEKRSGDPLGEWAYVGAKLEVKKREVFGRVCIALHGGECKTVDLAYLRIADGQVIFGSESGEIIDLKDVESIRIGLSQIDGGASA